MIWKYISNIINVCIYIVDMEFFGYCYWDVIICFIGGKEEVFFIGIWNYNFYLFFMFFVKIFLVKFRFFVWFEVLYVIIEFYRKDIFIFLGCINDWYSLLNIFVLSLFGYSVGF